MSASSGTPIAQRYAIEYGLNGLWPTPVKRVNLLESGRVPAALHDWLEKYADRPELVAGPRADYRDSGKLYTRHNTSVFDPPKCLELTAIKKILLAQADEYAMQAIANPLPEHEKTVYAWFVIQHSNRRDEAVAPHYHEASDVSLVYYLTVPSDQSGGLVLIDPRGSIERGGLAFPRKQMFIEFQPRRGDLLLLPRYVMHYTAVNTDSVDRKVISAAVKYERPR